VGIPLTVLLLGPEPCGEVVKALHFLLFGSSLACAVALARVIVDPYEARQRWRESEFLVWSLLFAVGQFPFYWPLMAAYVLQGAHPAHVPGLDDRLRILGLTLQHTAFCGRWAWVVPRRRYQRMAVASILSAVVVVLVFAHLPPPAAP
jgi:hypothetical protein